jgi:hypothetical protein
MGMQIKGNLTCPDCGTKLDGASYPEDVEAEVEPCDGDVSICRYCLAVLRFRVSDLRVGYHFEKLTDEEVSALPEDMKEGLMKALGMAIVAKEFESLERR